MFVHASNLDGERWGPKLLAKLVYSNFTGLHGNIELVGDYTPWLLGGDGKAFKGMAHIPMVGYGAPPPPVKTEWVKV